MKNEIEKILERAPLAPPSRALDDRIRALTEPRAVVRPWRWRMPVWAAGLGCGFCFWLGGGFSGTPGTPLPDAGGGREASSKPDSLPVDAGRASAEGVQIELAAGTGWASLMDLSGKRPEPFLEFSNHENSQHE